jgi:hypothetical protein
MFIIESSSWGSEDRLRDEVDSQDEEADEEEDEEEDCVLERLRLLLIR